MSSAEKSDAPEASPQTAGSSSFATQPIVFIAGAHFVHDTFTGFLPAILPLIIERLSLTLTLAGTLAVLMQLPSILNPLFGSVIDRHGYTRVLVILGPGVSGTLMLLVGLAPSFVVLAVLLLSVGLSVAGLHVFGPVIIRRLAGNRVGRGMSFFMTAGELARTAAPLIAVQVVSLVGLEGIWRFIPLPVAASILLATQIPKSVSAPQPRSSRLLNVWAEMRFVLIAVVGILMARSFLIGGLTTFLPTYLHQQGESLWRANIALAVLQLFGALGALTAGTLSDWWGRRRILASAILMAPPLMILFLNTDGGTRLAVLACLGFVSLSTAPVLMAIVLENAGDNPAAANGTYFMVSFGARALILLAVGIMGDALGLRTAYLWCAALAGISLPFLFLLPKRAPV